MTRDGGWDRNERTALSWPSDHFWLCLAIHAFERDIDLMSSLNPYRNALKPEMKEALPENLPRLHR